MPKSNKSTKKTGFRAAILLLLLLPAAAVAVYFKLPALLFYWLQMVLHEGEWRETGLWLPYYHVSIEAQPIVGVDRNASGLTFNEQTQTLFAVINQPAQIIELDTSGRLLRTIAVDGATDLEGIAHVRDQVFVLVDEREHQIYRIELDAGTDRLSLDGAARLGIGLDLNGNLGFEGVSWDQHGDRLFVVKEKSPLRVLVISGLPQLYAGDGFDLQIREWKAATASSLFMTDLSSLTFHEPSGNLLLLSDESAIIVEYAGDGQPVSMLPLWPGVHGLKRRVPQAEGLAVGSDGSLYLLSEPNLFYRFDRRVPARWAKSGGISAN
jgi:uncharacterized protein YjiK